MCVEYSSLPPLSVFQGVRPGSSILTAPESSTSYLDGCLLLGNGQACTQALFKRIPSHHVVFLFSSFKITFLFSMTPTGVLAAGIQYPLPFCRDGISFGDFTEDETGELLPDPGSSAFAFLGLTLFTSAGAGRLAKPVVVRNQRHLHFP